MKFRKLTFVFLVALISINYVCPIQSSEVAAESFDEDKGFETFVPFVSGPYTSPFGVVINRVTTLVLNKASNTNNHWIRYDGVLWSDVQPEDNPQLLWNMISEFEGKLKDIRENDPDAEIILIVRSTPKWAQKINAYCGPMKEDNIIDFAAFMSEVVTRYSAEPYNITYYEIWNEPDMPVVGSTKPFGCWGDWSDSKYFGGGYYADMLEKVYPAVKAANPMAQVVLGGLNLDCDPRNPGEDGYCSSQKEALAPRFIEGILANGGGYYFDYLNFHVYNHYRINQTAIESEKSALPNWAANGGQVEGKLDYLQGLMAEYNLSKPIIITEAGLLYVYKDPATPTAEFQQAKADYVVWLYTRNIAKGIKATTWFIFNGPGLWRYSNMLDNNQNALPAYDAYKIMTETLEKAHYQKDLNYLGDGILGFEFKNNNNRIWVLFSEDGTEKSITKPYSFLEAYDLYGEPISLIGDTLSFSRPTYIILNN